MDEIDLSDYRNDHTVPGDDSWLVEKIMEESFESTKRMLVLCEESEDVGCKTAALLHRQGEQIKNVERGMDRIDSELHQTNRYLNGLEKFCGLCLVPFRKKMKLQKVKTSWIGSRKKSVVRQQPFGSSSVERSDEKLRLTNLTDSPIEKKIDENISQVSTVIGNLKNLALNMSDEIDNQAFSLDRISCKQTCNQDNIEVLKQRVDNLKT